MKKEISMKTYSIEDLAQVKEFENDATYVFTGKKYEIAVENTVQKHYYVSNNDASVKNIAFYLKEKKNVVLDFNGAELLFKGRISPFLFDGCENVQIKNVKIDYNRPFFTQGDIVDVGADFLEWHVDKEKFPCKVVGDELIFYGDGWEKNMKEGIHVALEFDKVKPRPAYNAALILPLIGKNSVINPEAPLKQVVWTAEEKENGNILLHGDFTHIHEKARWVITHEDRLDCDFVFLDCKGIFMENVEMYQSGSMGCIFQHSADIDLKRVNAVVREGSGRLVSTNTDATHFVNCYGSVTIQDCVFENMMDDGCNVHGIYTKVASVDGKKVLVELSHFQQYGVNVYAPGDVVEFSSPDMVTFRKNFTVKSAVLQNEKQILVELTEDAVGVEKEYILDNITSFPVLSITNCKTGNNRPRGFLLNTNKKTVIKNNVFYNSDCGISVSGDNSYWCESTGVRDLEIANNVFLSCGYHCSNHPIVLYSDIVKNRTMTDYHQNITIHDNVFHSFSWNAVYMKSCKNVRYYNNRLILSTEYPPRGELMEEVLSEYCEDVVIEK